MTPRHYGELTRTATGHRLTFERILAHSVERVWAALADPDQRAVWFFAGQLPLELGGRVDLVDSGPGVAGVVTEVDPPHVLAFTWCSEDAPVGSVRFEFTQAEDGCRLRLTHDVDDAAHPENLAPGWHCIVDDLGAVLDGEFATPARGRWASLKNEYVDRLDVPR